MHCQLGVPAAPNTPTAAHPCLLPAGGDEAAGHPARDALRGAAVGRWGGAAAGAAACSTGAASLPAGASSPPGHRLAPTVAPTVCCRRAHRSQLPGKGQGSDAPHAGGTAAAPTKGPGQRPGKSPAAACACRKPTGTQPAAAGCRSTQSAATATYFCFLVDCSNPNKTSLPSRPTAVQVKEAKKICPDLVLVHVETIGNASGEGPSASGGGAVAGGEQEQGHSRLTQKACLERYRCGCRRVPYRYRSGTLYLQEQATSLSRLSFQQQPACASLTSPPSRSPTHGRARLAPRPPRTTNRSQAVHSRGAGAAAPPGPRGGDGEGFH